MPSVVAVWEGQCARHQVQEQFCTEINKLALCSHKLYEEYFKKKIDPIIYDGEKVYKKVLLCRDLFYMRAIPTSLKMLKEDGDFKDEITMFSPSGRISSVGHYEDIYLKEQVALFGVDFLLFDPRMHNYPFGLSNSHETSFVFMRCEDPDLNGRLVLPKSINPEGPLHGFGEKLLHNPTMDLRYYLKGWTRQFLGWVKHFYILDLYYWIWSDNPGDYDYQEFPSDDREAAKSQFSLLLDSFTKEARDFTAWCEETRKKNEQEDQAYQVE